MRSRWFLRPLALALVCSAPLGCQQPINPSFAITDDEAKSAWRDMQIHPRKLARPVIVLGGIYDPGIAASHIAGELREIAAQDSSIVSVSFFTNGSFDSCAKKLIHEIDHGFPTDDPDATVEVDIVAFSMGGLVARYAASDAWVNGGQNRRRLRISRLFTIGTPHRGAKLAWVPTFDKRVIDMRKDSAFLSALNAHPPEYEIIPYARVGDGVVGAKNASPPGQVPRWLGKDVGLPHLLGGHDTRILADIARRLRDEPPLSTDPPAPLPTD